MFSWKKNAQINDGIIEYLRIVRECLDAFQEGVKHALKRGYDAHFTRLVDEAHKKESGADSVRRDIEFRLYERSLLPDSREDLLLLLERLDAIPNRAEEVLRDLEIQRINIPEPIHGAVKELTKLGIKTFELITEAVEDAIGPGEKIKDLARRIDDLESVADKVEQNCRRWIFRSSDIDLCQKVLLDNVINGIGDLCDEGEDAVYFLRVFVIKRRI